ncbi:MAG: tetratricopeptide repeat protein [Elusimicrobia bacterium]|nr:tetratricopeptide repeat protein [Elusimicrobiota bacterium]
MKSASISLAALTLIAVTTVRAAVTMPMAHNAGADSNLLDQAEVRLHTGETSKALRLLDAAVANEPGNPAAYELRAKALLELGRHRLASADVDRAIELAPEGKPSWKVLRMRAIVDSSLNGYRTFLNDAHAAILRNPNDVGARYRKAWAHAGLGQNQESLDSLRDAVALQPALQRVHARAAALGLDADLIGVFSSEARVNAAPPPPTIAAPKAAPTARRELPLWGYALISVVCALFAAGLGVWASGGGLSGMDRLCYGGTDRRSMPLTVP